MDGNSCIAKVFACKYVLAGHDIQPNGLNSDHQHKRHLVLWGFIVLSVALLISTLGGRGHAKCRGALI